MVTFDVCLWALFADLCCVVCRQYEYLEKQIREHGAQWLKEEEEEQKRLMEVCFCFFASPVALLVASGDLDADDALDANEGYEERVVWLEEGVNRCFQPFEHSIHSERKY